MKVSLIGMSGSGKSYWAKQLEDYGFRRYCIDDLIEEQLAEELNRLGYAGIHDVAKWMGQPYEDRYAANSARYLALEEKALRKVLDAVEQKPGTEHIVVDTTGSVIHAGEDALAKTTRATTVVYLETPASAHEELYRKYLNDPKPVIWGDVFSQASHETGLQALARCYPALLANRAKKYKRLAVHTLPISVLQDFTKEDFVTYLKSVQE